MDNPGAFYAIALHTPHLREGLVRDNARPRRPHPAWRLGAALRRSLAQTLRAVAARLDTPQRAGDPRLATAQ